jgi:ABC-type phosphate transport system substrate-binding protein
MMLGRYRRKAVTVGAVIGASLITIGTAIPAGATTSPAGNSVVNGGGSNTTYTMMQGLSDLYNSAPGCDLLAANQAANQELNYACASSYTTAAPGDENGYSLTYSPLNPYNDVVWQEPALGSGNGIKGLELEGADTPPSPPNNLIAKTDFARSSRAAVTTGSSDKSGLNFVAYAEDAVPWFHFTKLKHTTCTASGTGVTPSSLVTNLSTSQLAGIYEGSITNWSTVGGQSSPIDVFIAQSGSGTEGTWVADLALTGSFPYGGVTATATRTSLPVADFEIFENEVSDIATNPAAFGTNPTTQEVMCNAIFFFSYGKFTLLCPGGVCAGLPPSGAGHGSKAKLGEINGVTASQTTIQDGSFALDRQLYNVYSDGSNANLPFANSGAGLPPFESQAVQNFVSTYGFLCNPNSQADVDPLSPTGQTYGQEIDAVITANGFFPIPLGVMGDSGIATPPDPGQTGYDANYAAADPTPTADKGFCRVTTTDGDGNN